MGGVRKCIINTPRRTLNKTLFFDVSFIKSFDFRTAFVLFGAHVCAISLLSSVMSAAAAASKPNRSRTPAGKLGISSKRRRSSLAPKKKRGIPGSKGKRAGTRPVAKALAENCHNPRNPRFALKTARQSAPKKRATRTKPAAAKELPGPGPKPEGKRVVKKIWGAYDDADCSDDGEWHEVPDDHSDPGCKWFTDTGSSESDVEDNEVSDSDSDEKKTKKKKKEEPAVKACSSDEAKRIGANHWTCKCGSVNPVNAECDSLSCILVATDGVKPKAGPVPAAAAKEAEKPKDPKEKQSAEREKKSDGPLSQQKRKEEEEDATPVKAPAAASAEAGEDEAPTKATKTENTKEKK